MRCRRYCVGTGLLLYLKNGTRRQAVLQRSSHRTRLTTTHVIACLAQFTEEMLGVASSYYMMIPTYARCSSFQPVLAVGHTQKFISSCSIPVLARYTARGAHTFQSAFIPLTFSTYCGPSLGCQTSPCLMQLGSDAALLCQYAGGSMPNDHALRRSQTALLTRPAMLQTLRSFSVRVCETNRIQ